MMERRRRRRRNKKNKHNERWTDWLQLDETIVNKTKQKLKTILKKNEITNVTINLSEAYALAIFIFLLFTCFPFSIQKSF